MPSGGIYTVLESDDVGVVVAGTVRSVKLVLSDGLRHNEPLVWFKSDAGLIGLDPTIDYELKEVHAK